MAKKLIFENMSEYVRNVFDNDESSFEAYRNLMTDLATGVEIFDAESNHAIPKKLAEKTGLEMTRKIFGVTEHSTKRARKRAIKAHKDEWFAVTEEIIDIKVDTGMRDNEFFNTFVDSRNIARGDDIEFWTDDKVYLSVVKRAADNHDFTLQRLGSGQSYTVGLSTYGIGVGADIDMYLTGRLDWSKFTDQCAAAFIREIQNDVYAAAMNAGEKLPSQFKGTGTLSESVKDAFDEVIENVSIANENVPVIIIGTRTALKKITALADVKWASDGQKNQIADMGRLGAYEGTTLFELPQRFALNDVSKKLFDSKKLLIMPQVDNKFIKLVDQGEAEITEVTEKAARQDDTMSYTVERAFGVGVQLGRYHGEWELV